MGGVGNSWPHCTHSQERGINVPVHFFFIHSKTPTNGRVMSIFRVGVTTPIDLIHVTPHRQDQIFVSIVTLNPVKLTVNINHRVSTETILKGISNLQQVVISL